jgi:biopolymer transport protein ExbD
MDAAPFLGVFFLLIIFLLLNSGLVFMPGVSIELPEAVNLPGTEGATAVVAVDQRGQFYFENQWCDEAQLRRRLQAAVDRSRDPLTLVVQADQQAYLDVWVKLSVLARSVGIRVMWLAVRPPAEAKPAPSPGRL